MDRAAIMRALDSLELGDQLGDLLGRVTVIREELANGARYDEAEERLRGLETELTSLIKESRAA